MTDIVLSFNQEAKTIAERLIREVEEHADLIYAEIVYISTSQNMKSGGMVLRGKSQKASALLRFFASGDHQSVDYGPDFILIFPEEKWNDADAEKREYIVDHLLASCKKEMTESRDGHVSEKWVTRAPDVQAFISVVERRGLAFPELARLAEGVRKVDAARQLAFADERAEVAGHGVTS